MSKEKPIFYVGSVQNAVVSGNRFKARLLEPGIISYKDQGQGVAYLSKATIDACAPSFVGNPLTLKHKHVNNSNRADEITQNGVIDAVAYNAQDGWFWCEGTVNGQSARNRINSVGKVSCGYDITSVGPGGTHHCIPYDYEITGFVGQHLAIEERPRYEGATIRLNAKANLSPTPNATMYKWFKKLIPNAGADEAAALAKKASDEAAALAAKNEAARLNAEAGGEEISGDTEFVVAGQTVKLDDIIAGYTKSRQNAQAEGEGVIPEGASIEIDGVSVPVSELVATHKRVNAKPIEQPKKVFKIVGERLNAEHKQNATLATNDTRETRLARGKELY
jgi:hypothetical protein